MGCATPHGVGLMLQAAPADFLMQTHEHRLNRAVLLLWFAEHGGTAFRKAGAGELLPDSPASRREPPLFYCAGAKRKRGADIISGRLARLLVKRLRTATIERA